MEFLNWDRLINEHEKYWVNLYPYLLHKGYRLRPRYHPDWEPSWLRIEGLSSDNCEDAIGAGGLLLDAIRVSDNKRVVFKQVETSSDELPLAVLLSSDAQRVDPKNCAVPILDVIMTPGDDDHALLVMPHLLQFNLLPFRRLGEFCEFALQILEGLAFLHKQNIIHRDMCWGNIMYDTSKAVPNGHHFLKWRKVDGVDKRIEWKTRWEVRPNQYYIIDFGLSARAPSQTHLAYGVYGQDRTVPEMSSTVPYNPFKADIYQLGNVFQRCIRTRMLEQEYDGFGAFKGLADHMTQKDPAKRPSASEAVEVCIKIIAKIQRWRRMTKRVWRVDSQLSHSPPFSKKFAIQWRGLQNYLN